MKFPPKVANGLWTFGWSSGTQSKMNPERCSVLVSSEALGFSIISCITVPWWLHRTAESRSTLLKLNLSTVFLHHTLVLLLLHFVLSAWSAPFPSTAAVLYGGPATPIKVLYTWTDSLNTKEGQKVKEKRLSCTCEGQNHKGIEDLNKAMGEA